MESLDETKREFLEMMSSLQKLSDKVKFPEISRSEFVMMYTIDTQGSHETGIKISDLAVHLAISTPAVSRMVKGLVDKGFVRRERDKRDRRITYVSLTEQGKQRRIACSEKMHEIGDRTIEVMGQKDMKELIRLSKKLFSCFENEMDSYEKE